MGENREGRAAALLPILIFLLIFLGSGFITGDFYSMPAIVAFLIALLAAFVQNRELGFAEKIKLAAQGVGSNRKNNALLASAAIRILGLWRLPISRTARPGKG